MGRAEIRAGEQSPPCPKCQDTRAIALARDAEKARFQCAQERCGELFAVPASQVPLRPDAATPSTTTTPARTTMPADFSSAEYCDKGCGQRFRWPPAKDAHEKTCDGPAEEAAEGDGGEEPKEESVSEKLICRKGCGREFGKEGWREKHEAKCRGAEDKKAASTMAAKRFAAIREKRRDQERLSPKALKQEERLVDGAASAIEEALVGLRAKRQALLDGIPELQDLNKAIAALEAIAGPPESEDAR